MISSAFVHTLELDGTLRALCIASNIASTGLSNSPDWKLNDMILKSVGGSVSSFPLFSILLTVSPTPRHPSNIFRVRRDDAR